MFNTFHIKSQALEKLVRLERRVHHLATLVQQQDQALRRRGMTIAPGALGELLAAQAELQRLGHTLAEDSTTLDQLRALAQTTALLNSSLDPDTVLSGVVDTAIAITGAERAYIVLASSDSETFEFRIARDAQRRPLEASAFTVSESIIQQVARTGQPVIAGDALLDTHLGQHTSIMVHGPRSIICVPLRSRERVIGVLYADNRRALNLFGEREASLLLAFANQAAVAIENAHLFARVRNTLATITEMKHLLDNVLESIVSGVITTDRHDRIVIFNRAAEQILGISRDQAIGQPVTSVLPDVFATLRSVTQTVLLHNRPHVFEIEPVLGQRGAVTLSLRLTPLKDARGAIVGTALVVDDLTEIRKRDATLKVIHTYLPPSLVRNIQSIDRLGLSGDEREISVVFADVRGFTSFSERLDPELLMTIISRYLTVCTDALQLQEGIVDKYMGDAVVGLFNTQLNPQDDHAVRAVRAALAMAYDVRALHEVFAARASPVLWHWRRDGNRCAGQCGQPQS
ncbi:MAG: hypothetical protein KatS3mg051_0303 [Anaerolineae bacterium]|nr:MAG: hypothetical protein KatS3mg051_0303 [Anaerolineae bacterium]